MSQIEEELIMQWIIEGNPIDIHYSEKTATYYASGNSDYFRGVSLGDTLQKLYEQVLDASKLLAEHRRSQGESA